MPCDFNVNNINGEADEKCVNIVNNSNIVNHIHNNSSERGMKEDEMYIYMDNDDVNSISFCYTNADSLLNKLDKLK